MKFEISRSLNGDKIIFIARDPLGNVRLRTNTLGDMEKAIEEFNKPKEPFDFAQGKEAKPKKGDVKKGERTKTEAELQTASPAEGEADQPKADSATSSVEPKEEPKQFLQNELQTQVEERKKQSKKKSFWDRLR